MKNNIFIVGPYKTGTTSIYNQLKMNRNICISSPKETNFFTDSNFKEFFSYTDQYFHCYDKNLNVEVCGAYSAIHLNPYMAKRIYNFNPRSKIVIIARNPLNRIKSAYTQFMSSGHHIRYIYQERFNVKIDLMSRDFNEAVKFYPGFIEESNYYRIYKHYLKYFSRDQIKILFFDDLVNDGESFYKQLYDFMNIEYFHKPIFHSNNSENKLAYSIIGQQFLKFSSYVLKPLLDKISISKKQKYKSLILCIASKKIGKNSLEFTKDTLEMLRNNLQKDTQKLLYLTKKPKDFWGEFWI